MTTDGPSTDDATSDDGDRRDGGRPRSPDADVPGDPTITAAGEGIELFEAVERPGVDVADDGDGVDSDPRVVTSGSDDGLQELAETFRDAIADHRHWERDPTEVPA